MDAVVRMLREGALEGSAAPLLLLEDTLTTVGGVAVLLQVAAELASCIAQGRAQAQVLTVIALDRPPCEYQHICSPLAPAQLTVLDCCTDPYGWLGNHPTALHPMHSGALGTCATPLSGVLRQPDGLGQLLHFLKASGGRCGGHQHGAGCDPGPHSQQCIIIDSLSTLLDSFGSRAVCQWLHTIQRMGTVSSVLSTLHADLHPPAVLSSLRYLAAGRVALEPLSELERSAGGAPAGLERCGCQPGAVAHGHVAVRLKRHAGRVRAEAQLYRAVAAQAAEAGGKLGGVAYWDVPAAAPSPQALVESAVAADVTSTAAATNAGGGRGPGEGAAAVARQMEGGMKLSLTQEEEEARRRVQLPYEHQGEGAAYQTGDFRDYLPPEAGGRGGRLGHILYVRDSASEHDSDEDPDDDLDL